MNTITMKDAAHILGLSTSTIRTLRKQGKLPTPITIQSVEKLIDQGAADTRKMMDRLAEVQSTLNKDQERAESMKKLRAEGLTLQEIGERHGLSRERIRQIIGNTGNKASKKRIELILSQPEKTNGQLADELGLSLGYISQLRRKTRHAAPHGSNRWKNSFHEEWLAKELEKRGANVTLMTNSNSFGLLVNGYKVAARYCKNPKKSPSSKAVSPSWIFNTPKYEYDFVICVTGLSDVFVIPATSVPKKLGKIVFSFPTLRPEMGKYQKYHEQYDLLFEEPLPFTTPAESPVYNEFELTEEYN